MIKPWNYICTFIFWNHAPANGNKLKAKSVEWRRDCFRMEVLLNCFQPATRQAYFDFLKQQNLHQGYLRQIITTTHQKKKKAFWKDFEKDKNVAADYFVLHTCGIDHRGGIVSIDVQLTLRASLFSTNWPPTKPKFWEGHIQFLVWSVASEAELRDTEANIQPPKAGLRKWQSAWLRFVLARIT